MIFVTGDTHADFKRFNTRNFPYQREMSKDDTVIVLGDFGGVWDYLGEMTDECYRLDWLNNAPFTTMYVDGNHENFDRYYSDEYPVVDFYGGKAHKIRDSVYHLMRGHVFNIEGNKFFAMGGAKSHDIRGGIFDTANYPTEDEAMAEYDKWRAEGREFRINHFSWWEEEIPSQEEMDLGKANLEANHYEVDYVISHCLPQSVACAAGFMEPDPLTNYFDDLLNSGLKFKRWYCGHYHREKVVWGKFIIKYWEIERIV